MCHPVVSPSRMLCVLLSVLPCTVCFTPVGPSVRGLQIESCYNIIFVWSDTEVSVSYVCLCVHGFDSVIK